jgi:hypothetical protein
VKLTPHPVIKLPTTEELRILTSKVGAEEVARILRIREEKIVAEKTDPYRHGYEPFHWKDADDLLNTHQELCVLGGNRAGKTEWAAKRIVAAMVNIPNARVWCLHTTSPSSIQMQQNVIWKYIPAEYKTLKKGKVTNVQYSQKNGFSDGTFIFPNGSQCYFMNYAQEKRVIEGGECDIIWCDELVPLDWIETLRYRVVTRRGKLIVTFTPISGYTNVVKEYISGCKVLESRPASILDQKIQHTPGVPVGHMPYKARSRGKDAGVVWFHSQFNPYNPFDELCRTLEGKTQYEKKIRAYGWADGLAGSQFPRFGDINEIEHDKIPEVGTNYMVVDPAGARNWFMLWLRAVGVGENTKWFVYREWPDATYGEWALPDSKLDGKAGPAQRAGGGRGIDEYKELIRSLEGEEIVEERFIDPRAGATQAASKEGGTSLIELLDSDPNPMFFQQAAGLRIEEGVALINDALAHDPGQPLSILNEPKLYISKRCENLIYSLREWTGADGEKGASKDPIDCLRYLAVMQPEQYDEKSFKCKGGGSY